MRNLIAVAAIVVMVLIANVAISENCFVPRQFAYQGNIYDDGGNAIPDGPVEISIAIKDSSGGVVYSERQTVDAIAGSISALIGNGLDDDGVVTGGIDCAMLLTGTPLSLELEAIGFGPPIVMQLASVPFAMVSDFAYRVAADSIGSDEIIDGTISAADFSDRVYESIGAKLSGGEGDGEFITLERLKEIDAEPIAASSIGVQLPFLYSSAQNVQGVLVDLDHGLKGNDEKIDEEIDNRIAAVAQAKGEAIAQAFDLNSDYRRGITSEITADITTAISAESQARMNEDGKKLALSGGTLGGDLVIGGGAGITLGGVEKNIWPGFQRVAAKRISMSIVNQFGTANCPVQGDVAYLCTAKVTCDPGDTLLSCSGHYNGFCWGDALCDYLGSYVDIGACAAQVVSNRGDPNQILSVTAICGTPYK